MLLFAPRNGLGVSGVAVPTAGAELLLPQHLAELERIMAHTQRLTSHEAIEPVESYPAPVQRLLRRLARVRADRLVNQVL